MRSSFLRGAGYLISGLRSLNRAELRGFVVAPLLINTLLFGAGIWWSSSQFARLDQAVQGWLPDWLAWLHGLLWLLFILGALIVVFYTFTTVANLIGAPFNSLLAERTARLEASQTASPPVAATAWKDLLPSPLAELNKLLYFVGWMVPLLLLSFVPGLNVATPLLWALFSAWMLALEYADYPLGNRGLTPRQQRRLLRQHWPLALGFGGMTLLLTLVPLLNFLVMPAAVIGATLLWTREVPAGG